MKERHLKQRARFFTLRSFSHLAKNEKTTALVRFRRTTASRRVHPLPEEYPFQAFDIVQRLKKEDERGETAMQAAISPHGRPAIGAATL